VPLLTLLITHSILIICLETVFRVSNTVLNWFKSYLFDRKQFVAMSGFRSEVNVVQSGVPQGSTLGPLLFNIYVYSLGQLLRLPGLNFHKFADDTRI